MELATESKMADTEGSTATADGIVCKLPPMISMNMVVQYAVSKTSIAVSMHNGRVIIVQDKNIICLLHILWWMPAPHYFKWLGAIYLLSSFSAYWVASFGKAISVGLREGSKLGSKAKKNSYSSTKMLPAPQWCMIS
jgi:hypothetical protein